MIIKLITRRAEESVEDGMTLEAVSTTSGLVYTSSLTDTRKSTSQLALWLYTC